MKNKFSDCQICFESTSDKVLTCCDAVSCQQCVENYIRTEMSPQCFNRTGETHHIKISRSFPKLRKLLLNNNSMNEQKVVRILYHKISEINKIFCDVNRSLGEDSFLEKIREVLDRLRTIHEEICPLQTLSLLTKIKSYIGLINVKIEKDEKKNLEDVEFYESFNKLYTEKKRFLHKVPRKESGKNPFPFMDFDNEIKQKIADLKEELEIFSRKIFSVVRDSSFIFPHFIVELLRKEFPSKRFFRTSNHTYDLIIWKIREYYETEINDPQVHLRNFPEQENKLLYFCPGDGCDQIIETSKEEKTYSCEKCNLSVDKNSLVTFVKCPCCSMGISKIDGCNQMFCTNCKYKFDYVTKRSLMNDPYFHNVHEIKDLSSNESVVMYHGDIELDKENFDINELNALYTCVENLRSQEGPSDLIANVIGTSYEYSDMINESFTTGVCINRQEEISLSYVDFYELQSLVSDILTISNMKGVEIENFIKERGIETYICKTKSQIKLYVFHVAFRFVLQNVLDNSGKLSNLNVHGMKKQIIPVISEVIAKYEDQFSIEFFDTEDPDNVSRYVTDMRLFD